MFQWLRQQFVDETVTKRSHILYGAVQEALADKDDVHVRIVGSIAALLLCVAYADSEYEPREEAVLLAQLKRVRGLDEDGVQAIAEVLRNQTALIVGAEASSYARELQELTERDFRRDLLDTLLDLAAADETITVAESNMLRTITKSLGLSHDEYLEAQKRHRDKLAVLKR